MFDLIAKTLRIAQGPAVPVADDSTATALRAEVETLFRADMDCFTRIAIDRRARKGAANRPVALAA